MRLDSSREEFSRLFDTDFSGKLWVQSSHCLLGTNFLRKLFQGFQKYKTRSGSCGHLKGGGWRKTIRAGALCLHLSPSRPAEGGRGPLIRSVLLFSNRFWKAVLLSVCLKSARKEVVTRSSRHVTLKAHSGLYFRTYRCSSVWDAGGSAVSLTLPSDPPLLPCRAARVQIWGVLSHLYWGSSVGAQSLETCLIVCPWKFLPLVRKFLAHHLLATNIWI